MQIASGTCSGCITRHSYERPEHLGLRPRYGFLTIRPEAILPRSPYLGSLTLHFGGSLRFAKWKVVKKVTSGFPTNRAEAQLMRNVASDYGILLFHLIEEIQEEIHVYRRSFLRQRFPARETPPTVYRLATGRD